MISKYVLEQPEVSSALHSISNMRQWRQEYNGEPSDFAMEDGPISIDVGPLQQSGQAMPALNSLHPISEETAENQTDSLNDQRHEQLLRNFTISLNNCEILESLPSKEEPQQLQQSADEEVTFQSRLLINDVENSTLGEIVYDTVSDDREVRASTTLYNVVECNTQRGDVSTLQLAS